MVGLRGAGWRDDGLIVLLDVFAPCAPA